VLSTLIAVLDRLGTDWLAEACDWGGGTEAEAFCTILRGGMLEPGHGLSRGPCL